MSESILVTSTSFLDTPGPHLEKLLECGFDIVQARGPLEEEELIEIIKKSSGFDGIVCGTDFFTAKVLELCAPRTRVISRYGVGLERVDLEHAEKLGIQVINTPRFHHTTVCELTFGLMIAISRKIPEHANLVKNCEWTRMTGVELRNKVLTIFGFGMVGKDVAKIALSFGMKVIIHNSSWSDSHEEYFSALKDSFSNRLLWEDLVLERCLDEEEALAKADFISLHLDLNRNTQHFLDSRKISLCKDGVFIINVSRGALISEQCVADALNKNKIAGYAADVLEKQPVRCNNPLLTAKNVIITPHIGGRTFYSVYRQGLAAVDNLLKVLKPLNS